MTAVNKPVLLDGRTVRLPSGRDVPIGPGLVEFRIEGAGFVTRFHRFGKDLEYGWLPDPTAESPETAVWGSAWSVTTDAGVRIGVDESRTVLSFPNGTAQLPGRLGSLIQDRDRFVVIVQTHQDDVRNVYCYDDHGSELWRIGYVPPTQPAAAYAAIDVSEDGTIRAMNPRPFTATVDRETGAILDIKLGRW